jgi:hypothetical protein
MTYVSTSERRFIEGKGQKYLKNSEVRCQAVSKTKLRLARLQQGNPSLTSDDVWPEAQCTHAAEENAYLCKYHGGRTPSVKRREVWEYMPPELQEKYLSLQNTSELMNLSRELNELDARKAELYESLEELVLGQEAYEVVYEAKKALETGNVVKAGALLQVILMNPRSEVSVHNEIKEVIKLKDKVTSTYFSMLKDMKEMATTDQVASMKEEFFNIVKIAIDRNIKDANLVSAIFNSIFELMSNKHIDVKALKDVG